MLKKLKKRLALLTAVMMLMQFLVAQGTLVFAASVGDVVINEIAWAGSADNSNDEWIELYNRGNVAVDLSGWTIEDDGSPSYKITGGAIEPHGYFLIEDNEVVTNVIADAVINLSLANAGDSLVLKDPGGVVIDTVNAGGGAWFAGDGTSKTTMERIDPDVFEDKAANWASAVSGNGSKSSLGSNIPGTPKSVNSNYAGSGAEVYFDAGAMIVNSGDNITLNVHVDGVTDLYAYGFEINYPAALLNFVSAKEAEFLKSDGVATAFNAALNSGKEGSLIIGNARLVNPAKGLDGSGKLFELTFKVVSPESDSGEITFGAGSFLSDSKANVPAKFSHADVNISDESQIVAQIANLKIDQGDERYSLKLSWQEDLDGANSYIVKRKMVDGNFAVIGEIADPGFVDKGKLVPGVTYNYQVIPVKNNIQGQALEISGKETRGLAGDNDRSDRVDGKDIENLARAYGSAYGDEEYNALTDTNFDGVVDGKDLIDIGVNFGLNF